MNLRTVFFGTAAIACPILAKLAQRPGLQIEAVVSQPDRPSGRHLKPQPSPVKHQAQELGFSVLQPGRARDTDFLETLRSMSLDLVVVAAYGQILPPALLDLPRFGCLNVHTSLLPKYRGAAPIQWALLNGDAETGVTIMKMDAGLDTGEILTLQSTPILEEDNAQTLHDRLGQIGAELLVETIPGYVAGQIVPRPQPETGASYARKIAKEDGRLDWSLPARTLWNRTRAFTPWPGTFTHLPEPSKPLLKIWEARVEAGQEGAPGTVLQAAADGLVVACGKEALRLLTLQREGGKRLTVRDFLSGHPLPAGTVLG